MNKILEKYQYHCNRISDINEHLPTLKKYGEECETIVEMGVRSVVSTWAFLLSNPKKLTSLDLYHPSKFGGTLDDVYEAVSETNVDFKFVEEDSLIYDMEESDLLFIDTWHDYLQLKKELNRHHNKVKKYIILHDTTTFGFKDESTYEDYYNPRTETNLPKGLWSAVDEFLTQNRSWILWEKKPNNNGLTILKRIDETPQQPLGDKKVALISTFCNTQEKIEVLEKNIKLVKEHGLDVIAISPIPLPESITKLCDYFFFTKDNPILDWPTKAMTAWIHVDIGGQIRKVSRTYPDYGFAGLTQIKQLSEIALSLGYDQFYHMIYDLKIDDNVIEGFHSKKDFSIYPSKRGDIIWQVGLHYMIFDRKNLKKFISEITLENYLNSKKADAFEWIHNLETKMLYKIESTPVEDEIYFYEKIDFFNFSPTDKFKFYIEKNDETLEPIKLLFYDMNGEKEIKVKINDIVEVVNTNRLINLGFNKTNYQNVILEMGNVEYDITEIIKNVKHNTIV